jgi:hypothetical protein
MRDHFGGVLQSRLGAPPQRTSACPERIDEQLFRALHIAVGEICTARRVKQHGRSHGRYVLVGAAQSSRLSRPMRPIVSNDDDTHAAWYGALRGGNGRRRR